ncbi:hypothetical protein [Salimicrobium halophilum]|uniref:PH domain-containing protein n=1 Tax=Salimicrobium halophilum TaxID=86666 RepID=A0A1G8R5A9_9BACI|nr:hypothetical protein [Salimicrobium halophilum]SDJ12147.1 hypothetical protein SAMN04490247_0835 [Salimicrobium halophilum]
MEFTAKPARSILVFFLLLSVTGVSRSNYLNVTIVFLCAAAFLLVSLLLSFRMKIEDSRLSYVVFIANLKVYQRTVSPEDIKKIKFKRAGWMKKKVVVKMTKGFNWRVLHFEPETIYRELELYANSEEIPVIKTNNYCVLEK